MLFGETMSHSSVRQVIGPARPPDRHRSSWSGHQHRRRTRRLRARPAAVHTPTCALVDHVRGQADPPNPTTTRRGDQSREPAPRGASAREAAGLMRAATGSGTASAPTRRAGARAWSCHGLPQRAVRVGRPGRRPGRGRSRPGPGRRPGRGRTAGSCREPGSAAARRSRCTAESKIGCECGGDRAGAGSAGWCRGCLAGDVRRRCGG